MAKVNQPNAKQDYQTPDDLLNAIYARYGGIDFDAACTRRNAVAEMGYYSPEHDALAEDWRMLAGLNVFCNPPFRVSGKFAAKAAESQNCSDPPRILLLVQAAVDTQWWDDHVRGKALVLHLAPRPAFVGQAQGINRALALCVYGSGIGPGEQRWVWRAPKLKGLKNKPANTEEGSK